MSYRELNSELVEKFGQLEQLCNQIYGGPHGVTQYINQMDEFEPVGRRRVPNWDSVYRALKTARHKRNMLSHGEVSFSESCAEQDDIDFIVAFRKSVLNYNDPISLALNKAKKSNRRAQAGESSESLGIFSSFLYVVIFLSIIVAIIYLMYSIAK